MDKVRIGRRAALAGLGGLALSPGFAAVPRRGLSNPAASPGARALYRYLWSIYGRRTLTGQQESNFTAAGPRQELDYLARVTGRQPAILGLDYITPADRRGVNARAAAWHASGGIVTLCWHWGGPTSAPATRTRRRISTCPLR